MTFVINSIKGEIDIFTNQITSKIETLLYWEKVMEDAKEKADGICRKQIDRMTSSASISRTFSGSPA